MPSLARRRRRSTRLPTRDDGEGWSFVTVCTKNREHLFGDIVAGRMHLTDWGRMAEEELRRTAVLRPNVVLDVYVIMPNHVHFIVQLHPSPKGKSQLDTPLPGSVRVIVGAYKAAVSQAIRRSCRGGFEGHIWQRDYHEHVIRSTEELAFIRRYIQQNPLWWDGNWDDLEGEEWGVP